MCLSRMYVGHVPTGTNRAQKELDSLELELQVVSRYYVCAGNQTKKLLTTELSLYPEVEVLKQQEYLLSSRFFFI